MHSTAVQDQTVLFIPGLRLVDSEAVTLPRHRTGLPVPWVRAQHWALLYDEFWSALQFPLDPLLANFLGTATLLFSWLVSSQSSYFLVLRFMQVWLYCHYLVCRGMLAGMAVCVPACYAWYAVLTLKAAVGLLLCWSRSAGFWGWFSCSRGFSGFSCLPGSGTSTPRAPSQAPVDRVRSIGPLAEGTVPKNSLSRYPCSRCRSWRLRHPGWTEYKQTVKLL